MAFAVSTSDNAEREILIGAYGLTAGSSIGEALVRAKKRGVDVLLIADEPTPSSATAVSSSHRGGNANLEAQQPALVLVVRSNDKLWSALDGRVGQHAAKKLRGRPSGQCLQRLPARPGAKGGGLYDRGGFACSDFPRLGIIGC